jgi:hypothetical protein
LPDFVEWKTGNLFSSLKCSKIIYIVNFDLQFWKLNSFIKNILRKANGFAYSSASKKSFNF